MISILILILCSLVSDLFALSLPRTILPGSNHLSDFSYEKWATDIVASPNDPSSTHKDENLKGVALRESYEQIFVHCYVREQFAPAWGPDVKACVEELASRAQDECRATKQETTLCRKGNAAITSHVVGGSEDTVTSCGNVAISAGRIMDRCYQQDHTVVGFAVAMGTYTFVVEIRPA